MSKLSAGTERGVDGELSSRARIRVAKLRILLQTLTFVFFVLQVGARSEAV